MVTYIMDHPVYNFKDVESPRVLIRSFWNFDHLFNMVNRPCVAKEKSPEYKKYSFLFFIKKRIVYQKKLENRNTSWYFNALYTTINSLEEFDAKTQ